ncbi:MAG: signal peptidase I [Phormidesmis sp. RL_2_1]|nr:signal peptidase I [Phormidesmis sp. RL_2_1]
MTETNEPNHEPNHELNHERVENSKDVSLKNTIQETALKNTIQETVRPKGWQKLASENARLVAIALAIAFFVRFFIAEPRFIPSPSMVPTLAVGDRLLVEKVSYHLHLPHPGDIVVFEPPPQLQEYGYLASQAFIKRVIGLPGQTVQVTQGKVLVDGQALTEPYILEMPAYEMPPVQVPASSLFMMGDNRNDSNDSHVWGFLPLDNVIGRAAFRFWPLEKIGRIGHHTDDTA